ncbi:lysine--tRNA ligase [Candidatus Palibaumannia cicadellinicola]|uniref:Lysine--tRNA ligase n=1 Tax=Candidatus Palibaumannia cicadellinicola TaxID=186490 RepID=A0A0K2BK88_9GAMM|nr:lysine--tRNA ligase [Candidatus Baumannia cicadellinicola]AKZ65750.1 Lysyl-tRNA synthetase (class II) [Candidatus Baumannia cicadellinicola]
MYTSIMLNNSNNQSELQERRNKLLILRQKGDPFPNDFRRSITSSQLYKQFNPNSKEALDELNIIVSVAGRMITRRIMGKASFVTLQDVDGKIQLYISSNIIDIKIYNEYLKLLDLGDILGVSGKVFKTRTGELSIYCNEIRLLTKALRPLPDKFHGIADKEIRYRQRYLDLITNDKSRKIFKIRSKLISEIRNFMIKNDFIEVETPMMHSIPGGAIARPFITHHNALDINMYLRIAPELYLKKLVVGGFERIFEINHNFRNEGLSTCHNTEFTMIELYMAYADYLDLMILIEDLFLKLTQSVLGSHIVQYGDQTLDFSKKFIHMTMTKAICHYNPSIVLEDLNNFKKTNAIAKSIGIQVKQQWGLGRLQTEIFEETTKKYLIQPTFISCYPIEVSPLARRNNKNSFFADRFELFIGGKEIGNGFSELNDSEDQYVRFIEQIKQNNNNKNQEIFFDEDYITALEYGLPPTAGLGIGIDRLMMIFTNSNVIRDVILFPIMRPKNKILNNNVR